MRSHIFPALHNDIYERRCKCTATAVVSPGDASQKRVAKKVKLHENLGISRSRSFPGFVGETTGDWEQVAMRALVRTKGLRAGDDPQEVTRTVWDSLSGRRYPGLSRSVAHIKEAAWVPSSRHRGRAHVFSRGVLVGPLDSCGPADGELLLATELCHQP